MAEKHKRTRKARPQLVVRISQELDEHLRVAAEGLELDVSGLVRMMLVENVGAYLERAFVAGNRTRSALPKLDDSEAPPGNAEKPAGNAENNQRTLDVD